MPITGMESTLASALSAAIKSALESAYGKPLGTPEYVEPLCSGIATALIPFLVSNVTINPTPVDPGSFENPAGAVTGTGETEPGTIS